MGDLPHAVLPSTLPCTTRRSMELLSLRETCPRNFNMRQCTNVERHQISKASILDGASINEVDRRHQTKRWEPLKTSGPGPWILVLPTKDLCPAVDFNRSK
ncbi:jg18057 [Pararge aegeria aegeria]|uniref:Jg18057 protein n=1 Tax=Pararge aegeria aegeria TaxID=348720 RepID=A0A8S4RFL7_9NEOP|nr:jg18057 [Pararge aegeria aegeria]